MAFNASYVTNFKLDLRCFVCKTEYGPTSVEDAIRWVRNHDHSHYEHLKDEVKRQQKGEDYVAWLGRTLSFARTYGEHTSDGKWLCGYCALGRHDDCIAGCGCECSPGFSGSGGGGF